MIITFTIPGKPTSTNAMYGNSYRGGRRLNPKAVEYKNLVMKIVRESGITLKIDHSAEFIEIEYYFYLNNLITAKGAISKTVSDCDNMMKNLGDAIFKALKVDDSLICKITAHKIPGEVDQTVVILKTSKLANISAIVI